jgi:pyruvate,water dikinase
MQRNKIISHSEDIFFIKIEECNTLNNKHCIFLMKALINYRKNNFINSSHKALPEIFFTEHGKIIDINKKREKKAPSKTKKHLDGVRACGGLVEGQVRILESVNQINTVKKDEIIVAKQTDPGWAPVFPLAKGLIIERGGMLSHAAIIAREYGIPTLVAVDFATVLLKNGDTVILDAFKEKIFLS